VTQELIGVKEIARMLGICTRGVWRLVQRGELPPPGKVGRCARWRFEDIKEFIRRIMGGRR
jgi:excisionase family DNA binding protein